MSAGHIRKLFPGGNTPAGFHSFYDYIISPVTATRILVIKGGPGVGKSTFMKHIGAEMVKRGYNVEHHCCSSDNGSLDGVVFPAFGVAMLDGTAPHVVDPKNPGVVDEIIHLGDYWDEAGLVQHKQSVIQLNAEVGRLFRRAYGYLAQAKTLRAEIESYYQDSGSLNMAAFNTRAHNLMASILVNASDQQRAGQERHLFASAITPDGPVNHFSSVFDHLAKRFILTGGSASLRYTLAGRVTQMALSMGYDVEAFHCCMDPQQVEHVIIPALEVALISSTEPHTYLPREGDQVIHLDNFVQDSRLQPFANDLQIARALFDTAFNRAVSFIARAKATHDAMEAYYVPNMQFDQISILRAKTLQRVLNYAGEKTR